ncbi:prepilin-type N-terminal cleavage/methylation domain-containing protein [Catenisphaera adipataccumulans]|nr:prepilin-type N-terminal cleavage/methylation domain-containing protein [Catenisphaera adipataccumulans]
MPKHSNGFTMVEMMLVMLLICVMGIGIKATQFHSSQSVLVKALSSQAIVMQEQAYAYKESRAVEIKEHEAIFDQKVMTYPPDIVCTPFAFHYNAAGNISQGGTVTCHSGNQTMRLVFQLGSGRVRIENE